MVILFRGSDGRGRDVWPQVEQDLARLLSTRVFPGLKTVAGYKQLLRPDGQPDAAACQAAAHAIVHSTDLKDGIKEFGRREMPKVQEWRPARRALEETSHLAGRQHRRRIGLGGQGAIR